MAQRIQLSVSAADHVSGVAWDTGIGHEGFEQRHVRLYLGDTTIDVHCFGDEVTRRVLKTFGGVSGGLLATLPDEPGPLGERDESALLAAVQGDHVGEGVAE